jgi:hypothetical protein
MARSVTLREPPRPLSDGGKAAGVPAKRSWLSGTADTDPTRCTRVSSVALLCSC